MDRQSTIGLILITIIFLGWFYWTSTQVVTPPVQRQSTEVPDSQYTPTLPNASNSSQAVISQDIIESKNIFGFPKVTGETIVRTQNYHATISHLGGDIRSFKVLKYTNNNRPIELMPDSATATMMIKLSTKDGPLSTENMGFAPLQTGRDFKIENETDSITISFAAVSEAGQRLIQSYTFYGTGYRIQHKMIIKGFESVLPPQQIEYFWKNGVAYTEPDVNMESAVAEAFIKLKEGREHLNATDQESFEEIITTNTFDWTAVRTKYFASAILNTDQLATSARIYGKTRKINSDNSKEDYFVQQFIPFNNQSIWQKTSDIYLTPLEYNYLKSLNNDLQGIMSLGIPIVVKPISEYFVLPLFKFLHTFIPSWGFVIIVFTLIIKILLYPLTQSSYQGMKKMGEVAPMMKDIQEKYKDDKEKQQQEMIKLYREHGYNPLGGCLPLLLQMPILFALYTVFSNAIELRQSAFLWASDLSLPDEIISLPFSLPLYGDHVSLWALLMAGSQIFQMKMTPQTNKEQAAIMMWVFPVMMLLIFNNLSAGLNMYYFLFNILTLLQQQFLSPSQSPLIQQEASSVKKGK